VSAPVVAAEILVVIAVSVMAYEMSARVVPARFRVPVIPDRQWLRDDHRLWHSDPDEDVYACEGGGCRSDAVHRCYSTKYLFHDDLLFAVRGKFHVVRLTPSGPAMPLRQRKDCFGL
jgi:hypothetical protein